MNKLMDKVVEIVSEASNHYSIEYFEEYPSIAINIYDKPEVMNELAEKFEKLDEYNGGESLCPEVHENLKIMTLDPSTMYLDDLDGDKYYIIS